MRRQILSVIFWVWIWSPSFSYAADVNAIPHFLLGAGGGASSALQTPPHASASTTFGLTAELAYAPVDRFFFGFNIFTFSPYDLVRATNYMMSVQYKARSFSVGGLVGMQTVIDGRANGIATDPLTGQLLGHINNGVSYGGTLSYDWIAPLNDDHLNWGISPVVSYVFAKGKPNFNELLGLLEFRVWGY